MSPYEIRRRRGGNRDRVAGGHEGRPYERTKGGAVGAAFMAARAVSPCRMHHRRAHTVGAAIQAAPDCRKTSLKMSVTEQRGKCEGGKKPPSRSIDTYF